MKKIVLFGVTLSSLALNLSLLLTHNVLAQETDISKHSSFKGQFVLRHQASIGSDGTDYRKFCTPFTENLNEFRHIDFQVCNARLSPKYRQFSRPSWEEIALDISIAKRIVGSPPGMNWEHWLKTTDQARAAGKVKLRRLHLDLLKQGNKETLIKLEHYQDKVQPYCKYIESRQIITDVQNANTAKWFEKAHFFNSPRLGGDLIFDSITNRNYVLDWHRVAGAGGYGASLKSIGAKGSIIISRASEKGIHPVCWIEWVPVSKAGDR